MTDDDFMDSRLRAAGARWRAATGDVQPVTEGWVLRRRSRTPGLLASAAVAIAALTITGVVALHGGGHGGGTHVADPRPDVPHTIASPGPADRPATGGAIQMSLYGNTWRLTELKAGKGLFRTGLPVADAQSLRFTGSGAHASVRIKQVCDTEKAAVAVGTRTLRLGTVHLISALPCPAPAGLSAGRDEAANDLDAILTTKPSWTIRGTVLTISGPHGTATFSTGSQPVSGPLERTTWRLQTVVVASGTSLGKAYAVSRPDLTLRFAAGPIAHHESVSASDGANGISGPALVQPTDGTITFGDLAVGAVGGTGSNPVEQAVDAAIASKNTVYYAIHGNALYVANQLTLLVYRS